MDTKFSKLLMVKKRKAEECEIKITSHNAKINRQKTFLELQYLELGRLEIPKEGSFNLFLQMQNTRSVIYSQIDSSKEELEMLRGELEMLKSEFRALNLEVEKAKYLNSLEVEKILKAKKIAEAKELDEVSTILYNNRSRG